MAAIGVTLRAGRNFGGTLLFMGTVNTMILLPVDGHSLLYFLTCFFFRSDNCGVRKIIL